MMVGRDSMFVHNVVIHFIKPCTFASRSPFLETYCVYLQEWALYPKQWYKTTTLHGVITERTQNICLYACENLKVVINERYFVNTRGFPADTRVLPLILYRRKIVFVWHYWKSIH